MPTREALLNREDVRLLTAWRNRYVTAFLTERGLVAFHYIDRKARIEQGRELFDALVGSVTLYPALAYRPRPLDRWPGIPFFIAAGITALVLAAYIVHRRSRS